MCRCKFQLVISLDLSTSLSQQSIRLEVTVGCLVEERWEKPTKSFC